MSVMAYKSLSHTIGVCISTYIDLLVSPVDLPNSGRCEVDHRGSFEERGCGTDPDGGSNGSEETMDGPKCPQMLRTVQ